MAWPIRFIESPPLHAQGEEFGRHYDGTVNFDKLAVGDLCYYHYQGQPLKDRKLLDRMNLTTHYFTYNVGRPPLILALPNHSGGKLYFLVDGQCYSNTCTKCGQKAWKSACKTQGKGECVPKGHFDGWTVTGAPPGHHRGWWITMRRTHL